VHGRPRLTTGVVPGLVETLTSRELEGAGMLAAGRSNHAVAGELVVTIDTVKNTSAISWTSLVRPTAPRPAQESWA